MYYLTEKQRIICLTILYLCSVILTFVVNRGVDNGAGGCIPPLRKVGGWRVKSLFVQTDYLILLCNLCMIWGDYFFSSRHVVPSHGKELLLSQISYLDMNQIAQFQVKKCKCSLRWEGWRPLLHPLRTQSLCTLSLCHSHTAQSWQTCECGWAWAPAQQKSWDPLGLCPNLPQFSRSQNILAGALGRGQISSPPPQV